MCYLSCLCCYQNPIKLKKKKLRESVITFVGPLLLTSLCRMRLRSVKWPGWYKLTVNWGKWGGGGGALASILDSHFLPGNGLMPLICLQYTQWYDKDVCLCVCGILAGLKANGASGDQSISVHWLWLKSPALLTPLILPLILDIDQEAVSHLSIAFCLTVCNINKNPHSSTFRPDAPHIPLLQLLHPTWTSAFVWFWLGLRIWLKCKLLIDMVHNK